tara:strand:+ start:160 stop:510 length:351 start_codon:yes stop_codon:yes gene_type:complete
MAVTTINLADTISQWVTKTNTISSDLGDKALLETTDKTNTVAAINELFNRKTTDSAQVIAMFNDTTTIDFDSNAVEFNLQDSCVTAKKFKNSVHLRILNSSGTVLKTLWSPDSPGG